MLADKQAKELEAKNVEQQESQTNAESLKKSLRKKEKEGEEKDREIAQLHKVTFSSFLQYLENCLN